MDSTNRRGVGIGIISRGTVPLKWMLHLNEIKNMFPGGLYWKFITVERLSWAAARNEVVRRCRTNNFEWLFFIDDDVFIPDDALSELMKTGKDIISGIYWTKTANPAPVIFEKPGAGPMYNFIPGQVIPIAGSGLGCCLINMKVFDKFDEAGAPYFVENWIYTDESGNRMKCPVGEDHYFFLKAKELGFQAYCHTAIMCDHYDVEDNKFYPGEKIVREYCEKSLKTTGEESKIIEYKKSLKDPTKKTIVFYNDSVPFSGDEERRRGIGGSEHDIIELAKCFQRMGKYEVKVYPKCLREGIFDGVIYKDNMRMLADLTDSPCDIFISSRNTTPFTDEVGIRKLAKTTILWAHDLALDMHWEGFNEDMMKNIDFVVALSNFHKENIAAKFPFIPEEKWLIFRNGVDPMRYKDRLLVDKVPGKCIYSSTPYRGLDIVLRVWPRVKAKVPHANLHVFSSIKVYSENFDDSPWEAIYHELKRSPGIYYHGTVKHDRLSKEQMESELLFYPNTFDETCCVTAMENQHAGTPILSSLKGALPEMVPDDCGVLIAGDPYSQEYQDAFVEQAIDLLTNKERWEKMHAAELTKDYSWESISREWVKVYEGTHKPIPVEPETDVRTKTFKRDLKVNYFRVDNKRYEHILTHWGKLADKILDVNCGLGEFPRFLRRANKDAEIWGTEESMWALDYCRKKDRTIFHANHPMENPDFEKDYFELITVIHHHNLNQDMILKLLGLLKKDGRLVIVVGENDMKKLQDLVTPFDVNVEMRKLAGTVMPELMAVITKNI